MFHFGEIEKGTEAFALVFTEDGPVVEEVEAKVNEATGGWLTVNQDVSLREVPPSRANEKLGRVVVELVSLVPGLVMEGYSAINGIS